MVDMDELITRLQSPEADERYDACEELRVAPAITAEATLALQKALNDPDPDVAEVAQKALDVHRPALQADPGTGVGELAAPMAGRPPRFSYPEMLKQLHSWGIWMLIFGVVQFFLAKSLFSPWGFLMVLVGLVSFYFKTSAMYIIYTITLLWAAISNAISGEAGWMFLSVVQVIWAYQNFSRYFRYRNAEAEYLSQPEIDPAQLASYKKVGSVFPITGCVMGALAITSVVLSVIILFAQVVITEGNMPENTYHALPIIIEVITTLAVLAFGISLAAILGRYPRKLQYRRTTLAILGLITSGVVILSYVVFVLWARSLA